MLKTVGNQMIIDTFAMEVYLPAEYVTSAYRGSAYYSVLGTKIRFLGIGSMRFFKSQKELDDPESVKSHPLGVPMLITTEPYGVDIREIRLSKGGPLRKCVIMSYNKGDRFLVNTEVIKNVDAMMMLLSRLEQGKLDFVPPEVAVQMVRDCETMNGISLRIPSEEMEIFVAERYRDPSHPGRKYRFHTGAVDPDSMVSYNMRTDAIQGTTFQGVMHEDINSALIAAANRKDAGVVDDPSPFERVIRGLDMDEYKEADYGKEDKLGEG